MSIRTVRDLKKALERFSDDDKVAVLTYNWGTRRTVREVQDDFDRHFRGWCLIDVRLERK